MVIRDRYTDEKIIITPHALKRGKERGRHGGNSIVRFARKALNEGIGFSEATGKLLYFIKSKYQSYYKANNIRVYGHEVYIFKNNVLLTVLELPQPLWECWDRRVKNENI